jgi:hypothetical protein
VEGERGNLIKVMITLLEAVKKQRPILGDISHQETHLIKSLTAHRGDEEIGYFQAYF